jgi:hypothetical protein
LEGTAKETSPSPHLRWRPIDTKERQMARPAQKKNIHRTLQISRMIRTATILY